MGGIRRLKPTKERQQGKEFVASETKNSFDGEFSGGRKYQSRN
jgi:hypothetical protein